MKTPTTPETWWANLDTAWPDILEIFRNVDAPLHGQTWNERDDKGELVEVDHPHTLLHVLEEAKRDRDHETMGVWLQRCWEAAPDARHIHQWPHWGTLCDLCSEHSWIFEGDEPFAEYATEA